MKSFTFYSLPLILLLAGLCTPAFANTIVVSTLPHSCCAESIGNPPGAALQQAIRFVPNADYFLDSITFDLFQSFGSGLIVAQIYSEQGGLPGTLVDSITASSPAPLSGGLFTITANSSFLLHGGTAYWLTGTNTDPNSGSYWWYSDQLGWRAALDLPGHPQPGFPSWGNANGGGPAGPGTNQALVLAFQILGAAPTPEPADSILVAIGLSLFIFATRSRDKGRGANDRLCRDGSSPAA